MNFPKPGYIVYDQTADPDFFILIRKKNLNGSKKSWWHMFGNALDSQQQMVEHFFISPDDQVLV